MSLFPRLAALPLLLLLTACGGMAIEDYAGSEPDFVLEEYFEGTTTATGIFIDRFGNLRRHFDVVIEGDWDGNTLTLTEDFDYDDGEQQQRVWRFEKVAPGDYRGTANDVDETVTLTQTGRAATMSYEIDLAVEGDTWRVSFEDWLWRLDEDRVFNRATVRRWGIMIGQVEILFDRSPEAAAAAAAE